MFAFIKRLLGIPSKPTLPREVVLVSYADGDRMLRANEGWRLAPEEDMNRMIGKVFLERNMARCDGNHGGTACLDKECWLREFVLPHDLLDVLSNPVPRQTGDAETPSYSRTDRSVMERLVAYLVRR